MTQTPGLPLAIHDEAVQGSYCPKLCTFACPVAEATGRDDAVPWSFHRAVADLSSGRRESDDVSSRLSACSGCLACQLPCVYDQDVPAQVVAARQLAPPQAPEVLEARAHMQAGRRPDGTAPPGPTGTRDADVVVVAGHQDSEKTMQAALALFTATGIDVAVVAPAGCCGALARALGDDHLGDDLSAALPGLVGPATEIVALDPHCLPELRRALPDREVIDVYTALAERIDALVFRPTGDTIVWHDPCMLARPEGLVSAPRQLLAKAGFEIVEPEFSGIETACSGGGLGLPLVDPPAAAATARRRAAHLAEVGSLAATGCSRARELLSAEIETRDALQLLAECLEES